MHNSFIQFDIQRRKFHNASYGPCNNSVRYVWHSTKRSAQVKYIVKFYDLTMCRNLIFQSVGKWVNNKLKVSRFHLQPVLNILTLAWMKNNYDNIYIWIYELSQLKVMTILASFILILTSVQWVTITEKFLHVIYFDMPLFSFILTFWGRKWELLPLNRVNCCWTYIPVTMYMYGQKCN